MKGCSDLAAAAPHAPAAPLQRHAPGSPAENLVERTRAWVDREVW